jgi:CRISPR-associated endoribonuclease Cas6
MFHDLTSIVVEVRAAQATSLTRHMGRAIQHVLLRQVVEPYDAALSAELHDGDGLKPYTVSGLMQPDSNEPKLGKIDPGDRAWFRMAGLCRGITEALRDWALTPPKVVEIDGVPWWLEEVYVTRKGHHAAGSTSYKSMIERAAGERPPHKLNLAFTIPTAFHSAGMNLPFPLPSLVFGSLLRQWEAFSAIPLPEEMTAFIDYYVMLQRYDLETAILSFKHGSKQIGFVGTATYEVAQRNRQLERRDEATAAALGAERDRLAQMVGMLVQFGDYSGVGIKTTSGMGMVRWA